jgi:hypothetical protein
MSMYENYGKKSEWEKKEEDNDYANLPY